ncbi:MAG: hypothetical protein IGQ45_01150 [Cyanobacterium sp. T60_A2020_053]|nr:hypothetical protein [Cyanobacterium sp. T60_A2020_053]
MAIIELKGWYLPQYQPLREVLKQPADLRLNRSSLLKSGLRADFLNDIDEVSSAQWFLCYLEGETVEFYLEGSGSYSIANIDLISREIYFHKQEVFSSLEPMLFMSIFDPQCQHTIALMESVGRALEILNENSRIPLKLELSNRNTIPLRLANIPARKIRQSLLFIADITPIKQVSNSAENFISHPLVNLELGSASALKPQSDILLLQEEGEYKGGKQLFDLPESQRIRYSNSEELLETFPTVVKVLLSKYKLF